MSSRSESNPVATVAFVPPKDESTLPVPEESLSTKNGTGESDQKPVPRPILLPPGYHYVQELGRGGMGVVYLAKEEVTQRQVALKLILHPDYASEQSIQRFREEAMLLAQIQHPNVVQLYSAGEFQHCPYLVMEYVPEGSLSARMSQEKPSVEIALELMEKISQGVQSAHDEGIIHRDLKPQNILLAKARPDQPWSTPWGTPKIADFGLAKLFNSTGQQLTASNMILGTPAYMSPEQATGKTKEITKASDVYALGAILYSMLAGQPPFTGDSSIDVINKVQNATPSRPSRINARIPKALDAICMKCLEKNPAQRYASAGLLSRELRKLRNTLTPAVITSTAEQQTIVLKTDRRRLAPLATGLLLLIVLAGILGWWLLSHPAEKHTIAQSTATTPVPSEPAKLPVYPVVGEEYLAKLKTLGFQQQENKYRLLLDNKHFITLYTTQDHRLLKAVYQARTEQQLELVPGENTIIAVEKTTINGEPRSQLILRGQLAELHLLHEVFGTTKAELPEMNLTLFIPDSTRPKEQQELSQLVGKVEGNFKLIRHSPLMPMEVSPEKLAQDSSGKFRLDLVAGQMPKFDIPEFTLTFTMDEIRRSWLAGLHDGRQIADVSIGDSPVAFVQWKDIKLTGITLSQVSPDISLQPPLNANIRAKFQVTAKLQKLIKKRIVASGSITKDKMAMQGSEVKYDWAPDEPFVFTYQVEAACHMKADVLWPRGNTPKSVKFYFDFEPVKLTSVNMDKSYEVVRLFLITVVNNVLKDKFSTYEYPVSNAGNQELLSKLHDISLQVNQQGDKKFVTAKVYLLLGE